MCTNQVFHSNEINEEGHSKTIRQVQETRLKSTIQIQSRSVLTLSDSGVVEEDQLFQFLSHELSALPKTLTSFNLMVMWRTVRKDESGRLQLLRQFIHLLENDPKSIHLTEFYYGKSLLSVMIQILASLPLNEWRPLIPHLDRFLELLSPSSINLVSTFAFFHDYGSLNISPLFLLLNYFQQQHQPTSMNNDDDQKLNEEQAQIYHFMTQLWHALIRQLNQIIKLYRSSCKQEQLTTIYSQQLLNLYDDQLYPFPMGELTQECDTMLMDCYQSMHRTICLFFQSFVKFDSPKSMAVMDNVWLNHLSHLSYIQHQERECLGTLLEGAIVTYFTNRFKHPECYQWIKTMLTNPRFQTTDLFQPIRTLGQSDFVLTTSRYNRTTNSYDAIPINMNGKTISEFIDYLNPLYFKKKTEQIYQSEMIQLIQEMRLNWTQVHWPSIQHELNQHIISDLSALVLEYAGRGQTEPSDSRGGGRK